MIDLLNMDELENAEQIWRLQHAAYAVEASIIGFWNLPPLMDTIESIRACGETFYGVRVDKDDPGSDIIAAISYEEEDDAVRICRMMVNPEYFRKGLASKLIRHVEALFPDAEGFLVTTGSMNEPAIQLYQSMGFTFKREWMPIVGLSVTEFYKPSGRSK